MNKSSREKGAMFPKTSEKKARKKPSVARRHGYGKLSSGVSTQRAEPKKRIPPPGKKKKGSAHQPKQKKKAEIDSIAARKRNADKTSGRNSPRPINGTYDRGVNQKPEGLGTKSQPKCRKGREEMTASLKTNG